MKTTFIKKHNEMPRRDFNNCHDGKGAIRWLGVLDGNDPGGKILKFVHDDVLPPKTSIGIHTHTDDQEYYYIISGQGVMTLDGQESEVNAGDITIVFPSGQHGLENRSDEDLRILVFCITAEGV
ncbi:MAG: cupin domain-containing protein [Kiritimatiellae bacterium]|nr:cupin domain-containing protein [Kiritimatiellia bacterium]